MKINITSFFSLAIEKVSNIASSIWPQYDEKKQVNVGSAAAGREDKKVKKYSNLSENYHFVPIGIETYGTYGPQAIKLIKQIG